jgi:hypothetical protein
MEQMIINRDFSAISPSARWMFFKDMGFVIDKEAKVKYSEMSSFKYMVKSMALKHLFKLKSAGKILATWRLKAV